MADGNILYALKDKECVIKMIGEVRHTISAQLDLLIDQIFQTESAGACVIDLTDATYVDSTNLGLIAKIAKFLSIQKKEKAIIVSNNEEVNIVLSSMGFEDYFIIVHEYQIDDAQLEQISESEQENLQKAQMILEAHETLMEMNKKNAHDFHAVTELFKQRIKNSDNDTGKCD